MGPPLEGMPTVIGVVLLVAFAAVTCGMILGAWWAGSRRMVVDAERLADIEASLADAMADLEDANRILRLSQPTDALLEPLEEAERMLIGLLNRVMLWSAEA